MVQSDLQMMQLFLIKFLLKIYNKIFLKYTQFNFELIIYKMAWTWC